MKKKALLGLILLTLVALMALPLVGACAEPAPTPTPAPTPAPAPTPTQPAKDKIIIGGARPLSGPNAIYETTAFGPCYKLWIDQINADGGLYIKEYGKKLPIVYEDYIYDDKSDLGTMTRLVEKLIVEDKVDFCLPPASTAFLFAAGPIFNKHGYILLGAEGGCTTITDVLPTLPYFFGVLNYSDRYQLPVLAGIFKEVGVKSVAIVFLQDLHGIEYSGVGTVEFDKAGIDVAMVKSVPPDIQDASLILTEAQERGVDALCLFCYPPQSFLIIGQAIAMGINFNAVVVGPGGCFNVFPDSFGPAAEGVMFEGAWNCKSSPEAKEFCDLFWSVYPPEVADWWGGLYYYGALQFFGQAIVEAGTLDQSVIRDVMATKHFDTVLGDTYFEMFGDGGGLLALECHPGEIGQWQSGVPEVIDPGEDRTADPIYPKPNWPAPEE